MSTLVKRSIKAVFPGSSDYGISLEGALKSRINSLTRGAKGKLLNCRISTPMHELLDRPCVIELESFADNDEKAFVMALLLSRIYEYRMGKPEQSLKHVLVIEEAHRLLSKPPTSGELSSNSRGKSVEVFADMLAEVRAYGQGIIVADQIPDKLIPDVLKNTDVKIVHRLTAKDDREAVGAAMNLDKEQMADLARSDPGLATVSFYGLNRPLRVKVKKIDLRPEIRCTGTRRFYSNYCHKILLRRGNTAPPNNEDRWTQDTALRLTDTLLLTAVHTDWEGLRQLRLKLSDDPDFTNRFRRHDLGDILPDAIFQRMQDVEEMLVTSLKKANHQEESEPCAVPELISQIHILYSRLAAMAYLWCSEDAYSSPLNRLNDTVSGYFSEGDTCITTLLCRVWCHLHEEVWTEEISYLDRSRYAGELPDWAKQKARDLLLAPAGLECGYLDEVAQSIIGGMHELRADLVNAEEAQTAKNEICIEAQLN